MITSSNSPVRRSGTPNQLLGVSLHTTAMFGLSRVWTESFHLLVVPFLAHHPEQLNGQPAGHGDLGDLPASPHRQGEVLIAPLRDAACRNLRRFYQQETQQRVALFGDVYQPASLPARLLQRHQPQIACDLLATLKTIRSPDDQHEGQCRQWTYPRMRHQALRLRTFLRFLLDRLRQMRDPGIQRSRSSNRSRRLRLAHGANRIASSCSRPASRHNRFLQRMPSLSATACSWFMTRVRACTMRWRCHSSCRRSRFSQLGTQIRGESSFSINSESVAHPGDPSSVCVLAWLGSRLRRPSTTRSSAPPAVVQTSAHAHWLPSPRAPLFPGPRDYGRTSPLPRDAAVAALVKYAAEFGSDKELEEGLFRELDCYYMPSGVGLSCKVWLEQIAEELR